MRVLKILFFSIVAVIILAIIVLFVFISTFDANRFKPQIIAASQKALGRPVDFGRARINMSVARGLFVNIEDFSISEDEAFGAGVFLSVDSVSVGLDVVPLITKRLVKLTDIVIQSPLVSVIRKKDGSLNVQTIGKQEPTRGDSGKSDVVSGKGPQVMAAPLVVAKAVSVRDAVVKYRDESMSPPLEFSISAIDAAVNGFTLDKPWKFRVQAAALSPDQNLLFTGTGSVDMAGPFFILRDTNFSVDLDTVDLMQLKKILALLPPEALPGELGGRFEMVIKELKAGPKGLSSLVIEVELRDGKVKTRQMSSAVDNIKVRAGLTESLCTVHEISASLGKGRLSAKGQVDDYLRRRRFKAEATLDDVNLKEFLDQKKSDISVEGLLRGSMNLSGEGLSAESLRKTLVGDGKLEVVKGQVKGVNILHLALSKITMLPNLLDTVISSVPESYRDKLLTDSTVIDKASFDATISSGVMQLRPLSVEADGFVFSGNGLAAMNRTYSFEGTLAIPKDMSQKMIQGTKELEYLTDDNGNISFPFVVRGQDGQVSFTPDLEYISNRVIRAAGTQEVNKLLDKVFGSEEAPQGESSDGAGDGVKKEVSTERQIIEGVLDKILR